MPPAGEVVEDLEDDVERLLLSLEVLHVVDEEHVDLLVPLLEVAVARLLLVVARRRLGVIAEELGRVDVDRGQVGHRLADVVLDGPEQVRLPEP